MNSHFIHFKNNDRRSQSLARRARFTAKLCKFTEQMEKKTSPHWPCGVQGPHHRKHWLE